MRNSRGRVDKGDEEERDKEGVRICDRCKGSGLSPNRNRFCTSCLGTGQQDRKQSGWQ